jgi:hypothetical protein
MKEKVEQELNQYFLPKVATDIFLTPSFQNFILKKKTKRKKVE